MTGMKDTLGDDLWSQSQQTGPQQISPLAGVLDYYPVGIPCEVCDLFERFALEARAQGAPKYSADAILHRIRWHQQIERRIYDFKCNNNWTSALARWFMAKHPKLDGFFETRRAKGD